MNIKLLELYINKIKKEDMYIFLKNNNIILNSDELNYLYKILKTKYKLILENDTNIFNEIKNNINIDNYNKLLELYDKYKHLKTE